MTSLNSQSPRRGATVAGLFGVALASVLLLCGAGNVPVENFTPQGAMQADLNAGGHNLTNAATVSATTLNATNVVVSGSLTATNFTLPFLNVTSTPTNVAGYGITDAYTKTQVNALLPVGVAGPRYGNGSGNADTAETALQAATALIGGALGSGQATALAAPVTAVPISITGSAATAPFSGLTNRPGFQPMDIAGLQLWIDPMKQAYADGATVTTMADVAGLGNSLSSTAGTILYLANGINGQPAFNFSTTSTYATTSFSLGSAYNTAFTVAAVAQPTSVSNSYASVDQCSICYGQGNVSFYPLLFAASTVEPSNQSVGSGDWTVDLGSAFGSGIRGGASCLSTAPVVLVCSYDGTTVRFFINGVETTETAFTGSMGMTTPLVFGGKENTLNCGTSLIGDMLVYNHGCSIRESLALSNYLLRKYNFPGTVQLLFDGDSITDGVQAKIDGGLPQQVLPLLGGVANFNVANIAVSGQTAENLAGTLAHKELAGIKTSCAPRIAILWIGTNSNFAGESATMIEASVNASCASLRTQGYKVVLVDMLPRDGSGTPSGFETTRQAFNAYYETNWATYADAFADVGTDATMGQATDENSATYYDGTGTHPISAGYAVLAPEIANAIKKILHVPVTLTGTLASGSCTIANPTILAGSVVRPVHLGTSTANAGALFTVSVVGPTGGVAGYAVIKSTNAADNDTIQISVQ